MKPMEWNKQRRKAFAESLQTFIDNFNIERIIVMICLFAKNYEIMTEACDCLLSELPENWMLLAETEDIAKLWQDEILRRNRAEKRDLTDRCVIGMPWEQVDTTIRQVVKMDEMHTCLLATSTGALVGVREKTLKDWCDIDVLHAGDFDIGEDEKKRKEMEVEEFFYRGEQASWLNFWFRDQVLKRDIHDNLIQLVQDALCSGRKEAGEKVTCVQILHQPGAGGTTSAKHVLWEMRKKYRCCVVKAITSQTCDELHEVWRYKDETPKPLLVLIDNEDEDKYLQLRGQLEEKGQKSWRNAEESFEVYCTIIHCIRRTVLPRQIKHTQTVLRQELTKNELEWFRFKLESLETRFKKDKSNVNPKFLISFNILRENFKQDYVEKVVKEFSDTVTNDKEIKLLTVISFLNTFDLQFAPIPISCLDKILEPETNITVRDRSGCLTRKQKWEASLSEGVKVLLNLSSGRDRKARTTLRVFNKIIAEEILKRMKERTEQKESEILLELLDSGIFEHESSDLKELQYLINRVVKKRGDNPESHTKNEFSNFVHCVLTNEGAEVVLELLKSLFELNKDPFTAQLIARFYISVKNWELAQRYAETATHMLPSNSFLWDTYGQVFKNHLWDKISRVAAEEMTNDNIHELIELSEQCIGAFRKEQKVSECEATTKGGNNFAGYFGELRAMLVLLNALKNCPAFSNSYTLHRYLVDPQYNPGLLSFLKEEEVTYLKGLKNSSKEVIRRLEEEFLQMKENPSLTDSVTVVSDFDNNTLISLKANLDGFFGEESDNAPSNMNEADKCEYIRRRITRLGAHSLNSLLTLRHNGETQKVLKIYTLLRRNINFDRNCIYEDLRTILDSVTVLLIGGQRPQDLRYELILEWCQKLYHLRKPPTATRQYLETFLYFVLYNFPTDERKTHNICFSRDLTLAIEGWHKAFIANYPKFKHEETALRRKETTLFFLGNGPPLEDIVLQKNLKGIMDNHNWDEKWHIPALRQHLRLLSGTLLDYGDKILYRYTTCEGNEFSLSIPTSHRVSKSQMWQKRIHFYLGFSFSGPKAYGMSLEELGKDNVAGEQIQTHVPAPSTRPKQPPPLILEDLWKKRTSIARKLKKNPRRTEDLERELHQIEQEISKLVGTS